MLEKIDFCINGQETIDTVKFIVNDAIRSCDQNDKYIIPIDFIFLDFQMPLKNGIQVLQEIKEFYSV